MAGKKKGSSATKALPALPPYFDYTTYISPTWTPPAQTPELLASLASTSRAQINATRANAPLLLRIRQVEWADFHDVFVHADKKWSVLRLQDVIAREVHRGSVRREDVVVFLPPLAEAVADEAGGGDGAAALGVVVEDGEEVGGGESKLGDSSAADAAAGSGTGTAANADDGVTAAASSNSDTGGSRDRTFTASSPRRSADPFLTLDASFPTPQPSSLEHLPPGSVISSQELHALLTAQARAAHLAAYLATRATSAPTTSEGSNFRARRMTINSAGPANALSDGRRASFMMRGGSSPFSTYADAVPMPPVSLPTAVEIWYDVLLPQITAPPRKVEPEDFLSSIPQQQHAPHVSDNPIIMYEGYIVGKKRWTRQEIITTNRRGGMVGIGGGGGGASTTTITMSQGDAAAAAAASASAAAAAAASASAAAAAAAAQAAKKKATSSRLESMVSFAEEQGP
ncbi:hypothetical protein HDU87_007439 [Geranomyces variabilis]|uniref:Uncharacterized protein n=1 Tax=Geranomyces variabilis TaxID=109894 RepID=A0AAD5TPG3_9FUNG|nr:hypothetical protein HDU87_007439 [Geranomyces variabilis]